LVVTGELATQPVAVPSVTVKLVSFQVIVEGVPLAPNVVSAST